MTTELGFKYRVAKTAKMKGKDDDQGNEVMAAT